MFAIVHEERGELLLAVEGYLRLSQDSPYALACIEKAYALFETIPDQTENLLNRKDGVRIAFEKGLTLFKSKISSNEGPNLLYLF